MVDIIIEMVIIIKEVIENFFIIRRVYEIIIIKDF